MTYLYSTASQGAEFRGIQGWGWKGGVNGQGAGSTVVVRGLCTRLRSRLQQSAMAVPWSLFSDWSRRQHWKGRTSMEGPERQWLPWPHNHNSGKVERKKATDKEEPKYTICLPYVAGLSENLRRVCRKYGIRTVFTTISTLRQQLTRVKDMDPLLKRAGVVYKIPCSCGQETLETRLKEHQAVTR